MSLIPEKLPRHLAIIMDGNGRWAQDKGLPRIEGHRQGVDSVEDIIEYCREIELPYLTLYAFSVENWARPEDEVTALMGLLDEFLKFKRQKLIDNHVRLQAIGDLQRLPQFVQDTLQETMTATQDGTKMTLILALSYGAQDEILRAIRRCEAAGKDAAQLTPESFAQYLDTAAFPDPDLLIRTSGEFRISNFLLWQLAYSELIFTETPWPDFRRQHLEALLIQYQERERRFGQTSEQIRGVA